MQEVPPALTNVLIGVGCSSITLLITLYVKDSARRVVEESLIKAQADLKKDIDSALSKFREDFLRAIDSTYRRSSECHLMMEPAADRVDILDTRLTSHELTVRDLANRINNSRPKEA
jgi:hypothetical protein